MPQRHSFHLASPAKRKFCYPFRYEGNLFFFVLAFLWPPVLVPLLIKNATLKKEGITCRLDYSGSYGWLIFWFFLFFPIGLGFLLIRGVDVIEEQK